MNAKNRLSFKKKLVFAYQRFSYQWLLPFISYLPFFISEKVTLLRGVINAFFDLEWRSIALNENFVKVNTSIAIKKISPCITDFQLKIKVYQRYIAFAREELDAAIYPRHSLEPIFKRSLIECFEKWEKVLDGGQGLVVLCCHYDSFTMGVALIAMKGRKVNLMTSNVVTDPRVSHYVQSFYKKKYMGMEKYFNGGKTMHVEENLRFFYQALTNNEIVFILADLSANSKNNSPNIIAPFIDGQYYMAPGSFRLAIKTKSQMAAFYCHTKGGGAYHVQCSDTYTTQNLNNTVNHLYEFLQQPIKLNPELWLASEQLNYYLSDE